MAKITRERAMSWWNSADDKNKEILCRVYYRGRNHSSLTGREIESIWIKEDKNAKVCDTFKINEKVSYKKESESKFHLTVLNNKGVYINGLLHIPCGSEKGFIEDYPVIYLYPSNIEKAKKWWEEISDIHKTNILDIESIIGDKNLLMECDIEMLWNKYTHADDITKKNTFTYDDMVAIYNLGRSDFKESQARGKYIDNHKDWLNENFV